ncbi:hypothetical protein HDU83_006014 [Entophlyctis luteolus]|nr:hypothetical protein HDU83_006014 [Entophlyctis luteolus]
MILTSQSPLKILNYKLLLKTKLQHAYTILSISVSTASNAVFGAEKTLASRLSVGFKKACESPKSEQTISTIKAMFPSPQSKIGRASKCIARWSFWILSPAISVLKISSISQSQFVSEKNVPGALIRNLNALPPEILQRILLLSVDGGMSAPRDVRLQQCKKLHTMKSASRVFSKVVPLALHQADKRDNIQQKLGMKLQMSIAQCAESSRAIPTTIDILDRYQMKLSCERNYASAFQSYRPFGEEGFVTFSITAPAHRTLDCSPKVPLVLDFNINGLRCKTVLEAVLHHNGLNTAIVDVSAENDGSQPIRISYRAWRDTELSMRANTRFEEWFNPKKTLIGSAVALPWNLTKFGLRVAGILQPPSESSGRKINAFETWLGRQVDDIVTIVEHVAIIEIAVPTRSLFCASRYN